MFGGVDGCPTLFARYLIIVWNVIITSPRVCWCVADRKKKQNRKTTTKCMWGQEVNKGVRHPSVFE